MVPPDLGYYTVDDRVNPGCMLANPNALRDRWQDRTMTRRRDIGPPKFGKGGVPTCDMTVGSDNFEGIAAMDSRPLELIHTEQGPIRLPFGQPPDVSYMPSVLALNALPYTDSRRTGISDRYYR